MDGVLCSDAPTPGIPCSEAATHRSWLLLAWNSRFEAEGCDAWKNGEETWLGDRWPGRVMGPECLMLDGTMKI